MTFRFDDADETKMKSQNENLRKKFDFFTCNEPFYSMQFLLMPHRDIFAIHLFRLCWEKLWAFKPSLKYRILIVKFSCYF